MRTIVALVTVSLLCTGITSAEAQVVSQCAPVFVPARSIAATSPFAVSAPGNTSYFVSSQNGTQVQTTPQPYYTPLDSTATLAAPPVSGIPVTGGCCSPCQNWSSCQTSYLPIDQSGAAACRPALGTAVPQGGYRVGRGILGQPKLYVDGQPVRNFFRFLTP